MSNEIEFSEHLQKLTNHDAEEMKLAFLSLAACGASPEQLRILARRFATGRDSTGQTWEVQ